MSAFECCWSANDDEDWTEVDAYDAEDAAEKYVQDHCGEEGYGNNWEEDITVRDAKTRQHLGLFTVTVEYEPVFRGRPKGDG